MLSIFRNQTDKKEIGGSLRVMINSIPGLKINADGSVNMTENEEKISRSMKLDFYGDTLIDSPTTFESAVKVYKDLPTFANTSESVVRFSLSPITDYCTEKTTILNQISGDNVKKVSSENQIFCFRYNIRDVLNVFVCRPWAWIR